MLWALDAAGRADLTGGPSPATSPTTPTAFDTSHNGGKTASLQGLLGHPAFPPVRPASRHRRRQLKRLGPIAALYLSRERPSTSPPSRRAAHRLPPPTTAPSSAPCGPALTYTLRSSCATTPSSTTAPTSGRTTRSSWPSSAPGTATRPAATRTNTPSTPMAASPTSATRPFRFRSRQQLYGARRLERQGAHPKYQPLRPQPALPPARRWPSTWACTTTTTAATGTAT